MPHGQLNLSALPTTPIPEPAGTGAIGVPRVLHVGPLGSNGGAFIVMDHLELGGGGGGAAGQAALGRALAAMHLAVPKV